MDPTSQPTSVEMCFGYGGIHLGLKRAIPNLRLLAACEIEAFAAANMVAKMEAGVLDPSPIWTDLKTFPWSAFRDRVDILIAGYPCQPFSAAGKRRGADDPRHLWPHLRHGIGIMRPRWCFFENVEGHVSLGLSTVISDLAEDGYRATWGLFSAAEVGAPHRRKRVFILAHSIESGLEGHGGDGEDRDEPGRLPEEAGGSARAGGVWPSRPGEPQHGWEPPRVVGDTTGRTRQREAPRATGHAAQPDESVGHTTNDDGRGKLRLQPQSREGLRPSGGSQRKEERSGQTQPPLGRDADGPADWLDDAELCVSCDNRVDELRLLGNGVVPATAERAWLVLRERFVSGLVDDLTVEDWLL